MFVLHKQKIHHLSVGILAELRKKHKHPQKHMHVTNTPLSQLIRFVLVMVHNVSANIKQRPSHCWRQRQTTYTKKKKMVRVKKLTQQHWKSNYCPKEWFSSQKCPPCHHTSNLASNKLQWQQQSWTKKEKATSLTNSYLKETTTIIPPHELGKKIPTGPCMGEMGLVYIPTVVIWKRGMKTHLLTASQRGWLAIYERYFPFFSQYIRVG